MWHLRRINFCNLLFIFVLNVILFLAASKYIDRTIIDPKIKDGKQVLLEPTIKDDRSPTIEDILEMTRSKVKYDLRNYEFKHSGVDKIEDLLIESGGRPIRNLIVSSWRSGSTFLGQLLNAMPANFYHYEPLLGYRIIQIRGPPYGAKAISAMKGMFNCDYRGLENYFAYGKTNLQQFSHNTRLWDLCKYKNELCFSPNFTASYCKLFPFQSMKVVCLSLKLVKEIMEDKELDIKVVLLIRDPRGVMQSRRHRNFCKPAPDCSKPASLCAEMVSSYEAAGRFLRLYPDRFMVLRFEEIALNPNKTAPHLLKFLRLGLTDSIQEFLQIHTNVEIPGVNSTYRVSRDVAVKWRTMLDFNTVDKIQESCKEAMDLWGYQLVHNTTHMKSKHFEQLLPYSVTSQYT